MLHRLRGALCAREVKSVTLDFGEDASGEGERERGKREAWGLGIMLDICARGTSARSSQGIGPF